MSYEIGSVYLDEALLEAAGLLEFPEYYAYIIERDQVPVRPAQRIPFGEQTLQKLVKDNDDILFSTNEVFVPPISNAPIKLDLSSQLERSSFLTSSGSDPQLIVYGDRVTLTASYETIGLFPGGYLFQSYPEFARPKAGDKVIALVGTDTTNKNSIFCYIDQNGPFIINTSQIPSKTAHVINVTYYKKYESSKKINYDANNDGRVDILDTWHVNGKGTFETSSHVYETVKKQIDLIATGFFGDNKINYLNSDIKLQDELVIYKADRAAFFIKEGPFITFSFGAKLGQIIQQQANSENQQTVHRLFSTITQKLLHPNTKYMPVRTMQYEYAAMCLFKDIYDKSLAVEVAVNGILNKYDCEFQGTYILDNYKNTTSNEEPNASPLDPKEPDSHIDEVIIKHYGKLASLPIPIYTITNVFNQIKLISPFDQGGRAYNTFYIVDDGTCKVCVFNLYFETKGQATSTQEIGSIPDSILPTDGKSMGFPASVYRNAGGYINWLEVIPESPTDIYKYCSSGMNIQQDKKLISVVGKGVSSMNDKVVKPIMPITNALLQSLGPTGSMVAKGISVGSSAVDALFGPNKQQGNNDSDKILRHFYRMITQGKRFQLIQLVNVYSYLEMNYSESLFELTNIQSDYFCAIKHESLAYEDAYPQITGELVDY
ncbi:MAG: hypothetical protein EZS28_022731 [Streblomastix strix]|uniref:Uncharacterized protein n=1 Tax=Streblomastix strix TaxID=222440 RepID=A0A5J4VH99_9EUKA|nr:MAG: hypothetical protein EZS28_022731 [Streblomastix strix]